MDLNFNGQERVPATKDKAWEFINDPQRVASCLPDVEEIAVRDSRNFDATVRVAVGPVRGKFKFKVQLEPQADGKHLVLKISGGGFGSVVDLNANATLTDNGDATTTLDWSASATMRGPVATVGGRVLDSQAQRVISSTFANVKAKLTEAA
jgi:carbon monoxide dehydrogenase subunit G